MRTLVRLLAPLVLALLAAGCKKAADEAARDQPASPAGAGRAAKAAAPEQLKEAEPNDEWQRAQLLPARAEVAGDFTPRKGKLDDDWYKLSPGAGQTLALQVDLLPRGPAAAALDASLELFDRDRTRIVRQRHSQGEPLSARQVACVEQCFLRVAGAAGAYTLRVLGAAPDAAWELEPNDRAADATPMTPGAPLQGYYGSGADADFFKLALPAAQPGQFLKLELSGVAGVRGSLEVRGADGALIAEYRAPAEGQPLLVRDLSLVPPVPPPPPPPAAAPATSLATAADAGAADAGDTSITPDAGAADGGDTSITNDAGATDAGDTSITADAGPTGAGDASITTDAGVTAPASTTPALFLVVRSSAIAVGHGKYRRGSSLKEPYTLTATLENGPVDLEQEPNDDLQHATDLGPTLARSGYLAPAGDVDWYRVRAAAPSILHVEVSPVERADLELSVYAAPARPGDKPQLLAKANEGAMREGEVLPAVGIPAGDTFIKIESAARNLDGKWTRDTADEKSLYKLTAQLSPDDGTSEKEPNNDPSHAQQVSLPLSVRGFIWPRKDVDVFQFHIADGHPPISLKLTAVHGVDLMLVLRELAPGAQGPGEIIGTADAVKGEGEEQILGVPVKPGDYQVEVSSPRNKDASATQPYTLTVQ